MCKLVASLRIVKSKVLTACLLVKKNQLIELLFFYLKLRHYWRK
jgi:hypothetical protein